MSTEPTPLLEAAPAAVEPWHEDELYTEPAQMNGGDIAGVVLALLALAVIGICGYIWLNPELSSADVRHWIARDAKPAGEPASASSSAGKDPGSSSAAVKTTPAMDNESCPVCGMFTSKSGSLIMATFSDGNSSHFDSWDCAFKWIAQEKLTLQGAMVVRYGSPEGQPEWLDAKTASYLYGIKDLKVSMPPYIAAFKDSAEAQSMQPTLGGEVKDWAALQASFGGMQ